MRFWILLLVLTIPALAVAQPKLASADHMSIAFTQHFEAPAPKVYAALGEIGKWWDPSHSYSQDAGNLSLKLEAGACFCERWKDGSVEHGRVIAALRDQMLRIAGALGPLQSKTDNAILTFTLKADPKGTMLALSYRVGGDSATALDKDAVAVEGVLKQQIARLKKYVEVPAPATPAPR
jgi:uncharacterized protein YndB with AHSA1/START domain